MRVFGDFKRQEKVGDKKNTAPRIRWIRRAAVPPRTIRKKIYRSVSCPRTVPNSNNNFNILQYGQERHVRFGFDVVLSD